MNQNPIFLLIFLFLSILSCQTKESTINIRSYYYPTEQLKEGLVYEYAAVNNANLPPEYWFFKSIETDTALYLIGTYYDEFFIQRQSFRSEIVGNGVLLVNQVISSMDSLQEHHSANVIYNNVFPFEVRDSGGIFLMQLKWIFNDNPPISTTLTRNRRYIGTRSFSVGGKPTEVVAFQLREEVADENEGHWIREYDGLEYYAAGIGLVYYKKEIDDNFVLEYELRKRYTMDILEEKFKQAQQ